MKNKRRILGLLAFILVANAFAACNNRVNTSPLTPPALEEPAPPNEELSPEIPPVEDLEPAPEETPAPPVAPINTYAKYLRCTGNNVNLRAGAGTNYTVLGSAQKGTNYIILEEKNGWYKTYYRNQTAYISASYGSIFQLEKTEEKTEKVISEGYKLIGAPYVYGAVRLHDGKGNLLKGFSVQKFDCSSLIQYIFHKGANVLLNVNTRTQVKQGKYVHPADLQRGDCIFFTNEERQYKTGVERIGHVALYLGDNYILHTASDYARIEQISAKRWSYYIEARRFL